MDLDEPATTPGGGNPLPIPGYKWIRGVLNGHVIVDSRSFQFVWEIDGERQARPRTHFA